MKRFLPYLLLLCGMACSPAKAALDVSLVPQQPLIERGRSDQRLNFDLLFANTGERALELQTLEVTLFDPQGRFIAQRRLDGNGDSATKSILTIPNRVLPANGRLVVFNPFTRFEQGMWLGDLRYEAVFSGGKDQPEQRASVRVAPQSFAGRTRLRLPVDGEAFVHDGHDLTAHHRRLDITGAMTTHFGITGNFMRYAHDFAIADAQGKLYRNEGEQPEDWFGYGTPILATGDGVVAGMHDGMPDNRKGAPPAFDQAAIMKNPKLFLGNHVVIDHGDSEFSVFAHLQNGSVKVKPGQQVKRGETIGGMGMSGDAFLVHLHYQLQSGPDFEEGLPAYFENVRVRDGHGWSEAATIPVDSGDVVMTAR